MIGEELRPALRRWTAWHKEWKQVVGCVLYEAADAVCIIDPLLPKGRFIPPRGLPRNVALHVLITVYWHTRDAGEVVRRYGGTLWAPSGARSAVARRAGIEPRTFRPGDELPAGLQAFPTARGSEVVYWLADARALVPGDAILGAGGGGLTLCPASWVGGEDKLAKLRETLRPLLDLPIQLVLVSHGEPVLRGGARALGRALA